MTDQSRDPQPVTQVIEESLRAAYRRSGGIPRLARAPGGADKIVAIAMAEFESAFARHRIAALSRQEASGEVREALAWFVTRGFTEIGKLRIYDDQLIIGPNGEFVIRRGETEFLP